MAVNVPRGSTQKNVNEVVFSSIQNKVRASGESLKLLDVPCGHGVFANFIRAQYPQFKVVGIDLFEKPDNPKFEFHQTKAQYFLLENKNEQYDIITCISGIMCFDGAGDFFNTIYPALNAGGLFVVTNDNVLTVRDRIHFMIFGHLKRFRLLYEVNEGNWNVIMPQGVGMLLQRSGFKNIKYQYTSIYVEDFIFLPIALVIYPIFVIYLLLFKGTKTASERLKLFPFMSLIARHYVVSAEK
ncbi:class I SAM-dependent methyltransferase [bacterium]|nr:class I SAM-dependent methyltransferase [bacterium]